MKIPSVKHLNLDRLNTKELHNKIDFFEQRHSSLSARDAEKELIDILKPLFEADGYNFKHTGGPQDGGVDYLAEKPEQKDSSPLKTVVQYKHYKPSRVIGTPLVRELIGTLVMGGYDRGILLANSCFSKASEELLLKDLPIQFQLMNINGLRSWLRRIERSKTANISSIVNVVRNLCSELAKLIAVNPRNLDEIEWRDLERLLYNIFDSFGLKAILTPSAKDGGKDIIIETVVDGLEQRYLIEIKHWTSRQKVGGSYLKDFVKVVLNESAAKGLFISTYGYASNAIEALSEIERTKIRLSEENKIVSLCRTFVRAESGIWSPSQIVSDIIFKNTKLI